MKDNNMIKLFLTLLMQQVDVGSGKPFYTHRRLLGLVIISGCIVYLKQAGIMYIDPAVLASKVDVIFAVGGTLYGATMSLIGLLNKK